MEEPVSCLSCGEIIELSDANFYVRSFCHCGVYDSCEHGICNKCKEVGEKE